MKKIIIFMIFPLCLFSQAREEADYDIIDSGRTTRNGVYSSKGIELSINAYSSMEWGTLADQEYVQISSRGVSIVFTAKEGYSIGPESTITYNSMIHTFTPDSDEMDDFDGSFQKSEAIRTGNLDWTASDFSIDAVLAYELIDPSGQVHTYEKTLEIGVSKTNRDRFVIKD